jgi:sn-glycerol 3-phosphate transport system permease protein
MEKRVTFNERLLPYLLVAPQIIVTLVFFFWPSGQMIWQSMITEDAFGGNTKFVWFENFAHLFSDSSYWASARLTVVFSALVASIGLAVSLLLAVMADRVIRGATATRPSWCGPTPWRRRWRACCGASCSILPSASSPGCCRASASSSTT